MVSPPPPAFASTPLYRKASADAERDLLAYPDAYLTPNPDCFLDAYLTERHCRRAKKTRRRPVGVPQRERAASPDLQCVAHKEGTLMEIIGVIIAGIIIGLIGKFFAPGDKDNIPLWLTVLCGIGGVIIGWFIYTAFGGNGSSGVDWTRWIVAVICAAVLVVIASTLTGRNTHRLRHH
jgi:uncharacterized membrane protein YeaQ/YmgE (transglycosylase-associated protein family)